MDVSQEIKIITHIGIEDFQHPIWQTKIAVDCSNWVMLLLALEMVNTNPLQLQQEIVLEGSAQDNLFNPNEKQSYSVLELLQYLAFVQSSELSLKLLSQLFGSSGQAQYAIKEKLQELKIDSTMQSIRDLYRLAEAIFSMPNELVKQVFKKNLVIQGHNLVPTSSLFTCSQLDAILVLDYLNKPIYFSYRAENRSIGVFYLLDKIHRIDHLVPYYHYFTAGQIPTESIQAKSDWLNIIGDTYFGEYYTEIRKNKGVDDALQRYGYQYSFEKIKNFFNQEDVNIANFEAVFNLEKTSPLEGKKAFILGANVNKTLQEFHRIHINTVCLGNNHLKDYGAESLKYTLQSFEDARINFIGAGLDQQQAHKFIEIQTNNKIIAIFNGYWHRDVAYQDYNSYALGGSAGVSCLNAILFEQITHYKKNHPSHKVILICHWGVDFKPTHPEQEVLANLLTQIGVDLIIGHGAHTIQSIKYFNNKPVVFGIGNGVFNSNGEYDKYQALSFGVIVRINVSEEIIQLYPIFTNNLKTFWQPYPVDEHQFEQASSYLTASLMEDDFQYKRNDFGLFVELKF
ncbi:CapA family protein [Acinetobacter sp. NIPH 2699]|uniref:CapA family protein n=1 Tax=Acinetobacter sp. NIPH 2699 TaxID=2923433 RepID=UPI001F4B1056|nr:CapA family protein [Acinetobacter sp. NIPH 2699]MCH7336167.1 CapA family protein [Acinetobacter sp. NIPH 2699]